MRAADVREIPSLAWGFEEVYTRRWPGLVRLACATTGSLAEAEEIVQDVFVQLYRRREEVTHPDAWLSRAVVNASTSWVRRVRLERRHIRAAVEHAQMSQVTAEFLAWLEPLSRRQRAVLFLRYHEDLSEHEIADVLGCRAGSVKSMASRGLARLREVGIDHE